MMGGSYGVPKVQKLSPALLIFRLVTGAGPGF